VDITQAVQTLKRGYRFALRVGLLGLPLATVEGSRFLAGLPGYLRDRHTYTHLPGAEPLSLVDSYPILTDQASGTAIERHYFHLACWASRCIANSGADRHVDIGSDHRMLGVLAAFVHVTFLDIRPLGREIEGLRPLVADILHIPLVSDSVSSLSCLHAAEHIGLGRYGDPLNPLGTRQAADELARVLAPGGNLYFALPVGRPRVEFNAHRVHAPSQILDYFHGLDLRAFAVEDDGMRFHAAASPGDFENADYACGMFWFNKR
jgi:hypothetical protein